MFWVKYVCQREVVSLRQEFIVSIIFQLFIKATNSYLLYGDSPYLVDILKEMSSEYYILGLHLTWNNTPRKSHSN